MEDSSTPHFQPGNSPPRRALRGLSLAETQSLLAEAGVEKFRAKQLYQWIFRRGISEFEEISNLPRPLLVWLRERAALGGPTLARVQGSPESTQKALFRTDDGRFIESVVMRGEEDGRTSLCLSTQIGCAMGCTFCLTGFGGFQRNMRVDEIVGQAIELRRRVMRPDEPLHHVVFMGMGEPLHNLDNLIPALRLLTDPEGFGLSPRRVTVSTVGHVEGIERFAAADLGVSLAVSLNATTDAVRDKIMPINRRWPIDELLAALRRYPLEQRRRLTIEYVLLKGINDTPADARRLVGLLRGLRCKINLIMFNPSSHLPFEPVEETELSRFARTLSEAQLTVTVRWSKGREIEAACGQLAAHHFEAAHA